MTTTDSTSDEKGTGSTASPRGIFRVVLRRDSDPRDQSAMGGELFFCKNGDKEQNLLAAHCHSSRFRLCSSQDEAPRRCRRISRRDEIRASDYGISGRAGN